MTETTQKYDGVQVVVKSFVDMSTVHLSPGTYITVYAGDECIEVLMKHDKSIQVCVSENVAPKFFSEAYGA